MSRRCNNWWCSKEAEHGGSCGSDPVKQAWTPERRERVGRAARNAHVAWMVARTINYTVHAWELLSEEQREGYRMQGEASVRADEGEGES